MNERTKADVAVQGAANRALLDLIIEPMRVVAAKQRWTIAVHGSLNRDIDLIAVPWEEGAMERDNFVTLLCGVVSGVTGSCLQYNEWQSKPHGRMAKTLLVYCGENHMQIDLSVMPISELKKVM
jgi:hypothetical protein